MIAQLAQIAIGMMAGAALVIAIRAHRIALEARTLARRASRNFVIHSETLDYANDDGRRQ